MSQQNTNQPEQHVTMMQAASHNISQQSDPTSKDVACQHLIELIHPHNMQESL